MGARRLPPVKKLVALANDRKLFDTYKDRPDAEKIAVMARLAGQKASYEVLRKGNRPAMEALRLWYALTPFDLSAVRVGFTLAANSGFFLWQLDPPWLMRKLEGAPAGTFHDLRSGSQIQGGFYRVQELP